MSRLYDRLLKSSLIHKSTRSSFMRNPPVVISANSVQTYVERNADTCPKWNEYPIYRSPFDYLFIEVSQHHMQDGLPYAWGIGFKWRSTVEFYQSPTVTDFDYEIDGQIYHEHSEERICPHVHFSTDFWIQQSPSDEVDRGGFMGLNISDDFTPLDSKEWYFGFDDDSKYTTRPLNPETNQIDWGTTDEGVRLFHRLMSPLFMALSLINCKNVQLVDEIPTKAQRREARRREKADLVTYKTIRVNPMRTVKHFPIDEQEQPDNSMPIDLPLHIQRGHFKDFRDGKGLFGKLKGIYWWDQHVRGDIENGAVIKDYDVKAPMDGQS